MDLVKNSSSKGAITVALVVSSLLAASVQAQTAGATDDQGLEEIVITAQKRTEKLQDVPVSASVVSADTLANSNISDVSDLNKLVPSVNLNGTINGRVPMGMRGISSVSNEQAVGVPSGVAIMVDGVPIPSDSFNGNAIEDVQTVEVLKGPQATLGGRTAAAGVINYRTYDPTDHLVAGFSATGTTDKEYRGSGHVSGPIGENLEYSLSAYDSQRYFPVTNTFYDTDTNQKNYGLRAKLLWKISDAVDAKLTYHYGTSKVQGFNFVYTYLSPGSTLFFDGSPITHAVVFPDITPSWTNLKYDSPVNTAGHRNDDNDGQLDLNFDLGGGYVLSSTTAYQHENQRQIQDLFATAVYGFDSMLSIFGGGGVVTSDPTAFDDTQHQSEVIKQTSEELKLVSPVDQPVSFVAGLFYSDTKITMTYFRGLPPAALNVVVSPDTATYDVYGRATWKLSPQSSLITGLRYNYDVLKMDYNQVIYNGEGPWTSNGNKNNSSAVVGDVSYQHKFSDDVMGYATYARGYSPKVYNTAMTLTEDGPVDPIGQEHINHFEFGLKGSYLDRRLIANVSAFDTIYNNFQIQQYIVVPGQITSSLDLLPAGKAETRGLEFDATWLATDNTTVALNAAYIDAVFREYKNATCQPFAQAGVVPSNCSSNDGGVSYVQDLSGTAMPNSPKWKLYGDVQQLVPVGSAGYHLVLDGNYAYRTKAQMLPDNNPNSIQGAFGILNLSVGLRSADEKWTLTAFCDNVTNKVYYVDVEDFWSAPWSSTSTVIAQPARDAQRYGGVRFDWKL
ncbi:MAG: TonB-dependent receptor [Steroidobacteraceae bacterium]